MPRRSPLLTLLLITSFAWLAACGNLPEEGPKPKPPPPPRDGYAHTKIAAGGEFNLVVQDDGTVLAWGRNDVGQLGDGTTEHRLSPVQMGGLTDVISVHAWSFGAAALQEDGTVWVWGSGQSTPVQVPGLSDAAQIDVFGSRVLAVTTGGTVWWGQADAEPVQVEGLSDIVHVVAGSNGTALALESDGTLWMWGRHAGFGDLDPSVPAQVPGIPAIVDVVAGGYIISNVDTHFVLARDVNGEVWGWSDASYVKQEDGSYEFTPTKIEGVSHVASVSSNISGTHLALVEDGSVWVWGSGYLGNGGAYSWVDTPVQIAGLSDITSIHAGLYHHLAVDEAGDVWAWGLNDYGQLGDGTTDDRFEPVLMTLLQDDP